MQSIAMLQEMGLTVWQLREPDRVNASVNITLSSNCQLLIIIQPETIGDKIVLLEKIAQSIGIELEDVYLLSTEQLKLVKMPQQVSWIWFCGEAMIPHPLVCEKQIHSQPLNVLENNVLFKKQLWQQIKQYKEI